MKLDIFGLVSNPGKDNLSVLRLNSWCGCRRDPQSLTSRWKTTHFFHGTMCRTARGNVLPFLLVQGGTQIGFISDSDSPGDCFGRPPTDEPSSRGVLSQLGFAATLWRSFCLCQFWPRANCALRWSPTSRAKLRESASDYTQFDWWAPVASCAFTRGGKVTKYKYLLPLSMHFSWILIILIICTLLENSFFKDFCTQIPVLCTPYIETSLLLLCLKVFKRYK